jgi:hypothetical protein
MTGDSTAASTSTQIAPFRFSNLFAPQTSDLSPSSLIFDEAIHHVSFPYYQNLRLRNWCCCRTRMSVLVRHHILDV